MNKPTVQSVIALTGTSLDTCAVGDIIDDAALLGRKCLTSLDPCTQRAAIKWLAAHMISGTSDEGSQIITSSKLGDATDTFARGTLGAGISSSYYGQQAVALVPCLARIGKARASIEVT